MSDVKIQLENKCLREKDAHQESRAARRTSMIRRLLFFIWNSTRSSVKHLCNGLRGIARLYGGYCIIFPVGIFFGYSLAIDNTDNSSVARLSVPLQIMAIVAALIIAGAISAAGRILGDHEHTDGHQVIQHERENSDNESQIPIPRLLVLHSAAAILGIGSTVVHLVALEYGMEWFSRLMGGLALGTMSLVLVGTLRFLSEVDRILSTRP